MAYNTLYTPVNWTFYYVIRGKGKFIFGTCDAKKPRQTKMYKALEKATSCNDEFDIECWGYILTSEANKFYRYGLQPQGNMPIFVSSK